MTPHSITDEQLVVAVNKLAWRFLSHLGRNYSGSAPLHTLVDEDPRVRTAFEMASAAFEECRGSDIESALAEAGEDISAIDYSDLGPLNSIHSACTAHNQQRSHGPKLSLCRERVINVQSRLMDGTITLSDSLNELQRIQGQLDDVLAVA